MGVVYRAQDTKMFRRLVAIKVISENLIGDAEALRRFHVEQETVASLQHPNIVTIYDRGEFDDRQYFVMEYLGGCDLAQLIRERDSRTRDVPPGRCSPARDVAVAHPLGLRVAAVRPPLDDRRQRRRPHVRCRPPLPIGGQATTSRVSGRYASSLLYFRVRITRSSPIARYSHVPKAW
jgi:protein kinase-like protein